MPTRTRHRGWTRPAGGDRAQIEESVGTPLDEIDAEVQDIDTRLRAAATQIAAATPWEQVAVRAGRLQSTATAECALHLGSPENYAYQITNLGSSYHAFAVGTNVIPERDGWATEFRMVAKLRNISQTETAGTTTVRMREIEYFLVPPTYQWGETAFQFSYPFFGVGEPPQTIIRTFSRPAWSRTSNVFAGLTVTKPASGGIVQADYIELAYRYVRA